MNPIILKNQSPSGDLLQATFLPEQGMNMISYRLGDIEIIDQSTKGQFEERFSGLGPLIGPHFHRRRPESQPTLKNEALFPHIERVKAKEITDPFSHGIGRYAPWKAESTPTSVRATLSGKDVWNGEPLSSLEGQNFTMTFKAELKSTGLNIHLSIVSEKDSIVGIHYYYHLPQGMGTVFSAIQDKIIENSMVQKIPENWNIDSERILTYPLTKDTDCTLYPYPDPLKGKIVLDAIDYQLLTTYSCDSQENSWQLYHPKGASFVCIEPLSAQDPHHPNLTVSSLNIELQILRPGQHNV